MATTTTTEVISSANQLLASHSALMSRVRSAQQSHRRQLHSLHSPPHELLRLPLIPSPPPSPTPTDSSPLPQSQHLQRSDLSPAKRARVARYHNYVPEEETIRNDYSQRYVDGGEWPQNWVLGAEPEHRFEEYPKQQRLLTLKKASVTNHSLPPFYLPFSELSSLTPSKFDVILLDPPFSSSFTWDHLQELPIPSLAADPSFVFLWVGSGAGEGLERGREILAKWGYRRCEDVVWVKTNVTSNRGPGTDPPTTSLLTRTKQHCLIGIRGTVRRSTDSWFVHCNVDTDVIIWEGDPSDPTRKPPEMYTLIENFCLGTRRLEIFGRVPSSLRRGWVTVVGPGQEERLPPRSQVQGLIHVEGEEGGEATGWERDTWEERIKELANRGKPVVPMTLDIDALRPKSPFRPGQGNHNNVGGGGGGGSSGGVAMGMGGGNGRFGSGGHRGGFGGGGAGIGHGLAHQNQMMIQPGMMGMGMNGLGMGGAIGVGVDEMMGGWNQMMGGMGMGGMQGGPMGRGMSMPMMGQMGMGGGFPGAGLFNGGMGITGMGGWGDQGTFGLEGSWEGDGMMAMGNNMGMNAGMTMAQWGPNANGTFQ